MRNTVAKLGAVVALGIAVAGCSGNDVAGTATSEPDSTSERETSTPETTESSGSPAGSDEVTAPGTELKVGDPAVVPIEFGSTSGFVSLTVTAIETGDQVAFQQKFGVKVQGLVPYYLRLTVRNVGDTDQSHTRAPRVSALLANGRLTGVSIVVGELDDCQQESFSSDSGPGTTFESCVLQAARQQDQVTGARYAESDGGYDDAPIVWQS